ncbi:MAG: hypothetical protein A2527_05050 [Candidatus Lambdaproteobacteria bacterium RIFOXYD2_FULL_50_16]|uniref:HicB-like antitoxin of toxin-antitoxin system domain-containing protein n=1 Tax=Candidatus Lambdaproteobacteria bacterium RIFOXYD2_FULL_50_16 TaxID=1817772 RepID=A0A1F6G9S2_9PROT|nr:MAG: hypothetical protein A2527_05050 [Candidatus Lambdaproteobacteria bacterium RIFOXYD2_FULL_50_16]
MKTYLAIFKPLEGGGYFVRFPDVEGVLTEGHSLEHAFEMATDALALILADYEKLPKPSQAEDLEPKLAPGERLVPVPVDPKLVFHYQPKQRVNVSLPTPILQAIDVARAKTGQDRSEFLAEGAKILLEQGA